MRFHTHRETGRAWLYIGKWTFSLEIACFKRRCQLKFQAGGHQTLLFSLAFPKLIAIWFSITAPWNSRFRRLVPEEPAKCGISIHDWTIWIDFWSRCDSWMVADPWWRKGITFDLKDFFLGKIKYTSEVLDESPVEIELDGRTYKGTAKWEKCTWKRPRWFTKERIGIWVDMKEGLPHAGKGENSWDCGDDALWGWGVESTKLEDAIRHGIETVRDRRRKYGNASTQKETV